MKTRIRDLREDRDLLQKDIANILKVTRQQYGRIENDEQQLSYSKLTMLSNFYNVPTDYILNITSERKTYKRKLTTNKIKKLRKDKKLTQVYLSKLLNITQAQYSRIENNIHELSYDGLIKLANLYNTSIDYILGLTNEKKIYKK